MAHDATYAYIVRHCNNTQTDEDVDKQIEIYQKSKPTWLPLPFPIHINICNKIMFLTKYTTGTSIILNAIFDLDIAGKGALTWPKLLTLLNDSFTSFYRC